jgi:dTDP-glucose 4,6-dehydratase
MEQRRFNNILVTGGLGFIGWNFLRVLFNSKSIDFEKVINVDSCEYSAINGKNELYYDERYTFYKSDIKYINEIFLSQHKIDLVINFAASTHVDNSISSISSFIQNNVYSCGILMENCKNYWNKNAVNGLFIQVSTDEVFGSVEDQNGVAFDEYSILHPNNPYSASKACAELIVKSLGHTFNFPYIITNCSNNYGFGQHSEKLIPKIINNLKNGVKIPIYGDGQQKRDWLYVDDHCEGILKVIQKGKNGQNYLFGTNKNVTNLEITKIILDKYNIFQNTNHQLQDVVSFVQDRKGHDKIYKIDYLKSYSELDWSPSTSLNQGLEKTVKWYLNK